MFPDDCWLVCRSTCVRKQVKGVRDTWPKPHGGMSQRKGLDIGSQSRIAPPSIISRTGKGKGGILCRTGMEPKAWALLALCVGEGLHH